MDGRLPFDLAPADADGGMAAPAAGILPGRRLTAILLLAAAALDLTRCGLVVMTARHPAPAAWLVAAGLAAAALSVRTARGCQASRRWAAWTALLIGVASAPQAAASGFAAPYTVPDTATAALGILLAVAVLATTGGTGVAQQTENPRTVGNPTSRDSGAIRPPARPRRTGCWSPRRSADRACRK